MSGMKCDIILPVCDQFEFTRNCIESIIENTDTPYRMIVINNGTNPDTKSYLEEIKRRVGDRLTVVKNEYNVGWVKALNQGIKISDAPFLCFQNDDTIVTKGWLMKMIGILQDNPGIGIVNPSWEGRPNCMSIDAYGRLLEEKYNRRYIETDWARGFCVVLKREVVDRIGGIDEVYGLAYFDDVDFSVRAIEAGFLVVLAKDTYVYHHRNVTFFEILKGKSWNELHEKNKLIYYKKWGKPLRVVIILDRHSCNNEDRLARIIDTVFYLARKQHHIEIWSPYNTEKRFSHTNIKFKPYNLFLARFFVFLNLYINKTKRSEKRYDAVFDYHAGSGDDFNDYIKRQVDAMKENTKQAIHVGL